MADRLSTTFAALADPTRRAIIARLAMGETTVNELAKPFDMSGPAISKHLKVLENAGLITRGREAQWRPCRFEPKALQVVDDWLDRYRQFWEERLDRLEEYLNALQAETTSPQSAAAGVTSNRKASRKKTRQAKESKHGRKK
jgi:DNA-binding transcriptional ArsR family regulator